MPYSKEKRHPNSVTRKVLAGFLLVFVAILLALRNYPFWLPGDDVYCGSIVGTQ